MDVVLTYTACHGGHATSAGWGGGWCVVLVGVVSAVLVLVSSTRRRHQHWRRQIRGGGHTTHGQRAAEEKARTKCGLQTGRAAEGGGAASGWVREGVRVDMCRPASALGCVQGPRLG